MITKVQNMNNAVQNPVEVAATIASASGAGVAWLAGLNEVLITVSTLVAICVGAWTLYDKWRGRRGNTGKRLEIKITDKTQP